MSETSGDRAYYSQRKVKYIPLLALHVQGVYVEILIHGMKWFNATVGVSEAIMMPIGYCSCSFKEVQEGTAPPVYLTAGCLSFFRLFLFATLWTTNSSICNSYCIARNGIECPQDRFPFRC